MYFKKEWFVPSHQGTNQIGVFEKNHNIDKNITEYN